MTSPLPSPTAEQSLIIDTARTTSSNLLISALAGCAKTTTLQMIVRALPVQPTLCLAFNKRIATEMKAKLPFHCECSTLNSLGHRAWGHAVGKRLTVDADKIRTLITNYIKDQPKAEQSRLWSKYAAIKRLVDTLRTQGAVHQDFEPVGLISSDEVIWGASENDLDTEIDDQTANLALHFLKLSTTLALDGHIDFLDQLYMPTLFPANFANYRLTLVDEAQDLSPLNHAMLRKMVRQRLIAVGDPHQAIYGFRGAVANGMEVLREEWKMTELSLSTTFRCPRSHVERQQLFVPHFCAASSAPEGEVLNLIDDDFSGLREYAHIHPDLWTTEGVPNGAAIICRNNAPLLTIALTLIRARRGINLVGSDLGPNLIKAMKKLGPVGLPQQEVLREIDSWITAQIKKRPQAEESIRDRGDCMNVFASATSNLGEAIAAAEKVFSSEGPITLLTGHKAKGLEWDTVYHLDPWRIPARFAETEEARAQEANLRYVIETRSRDKLILVNAEDFI